jgi:hypothetical protein
MEPKENKQNSGHLIIGIVALLALLIAWYAFSGTEEEVLPVVVDESQEAAQEVETAADRAAVSAEANTEEAIEDAQLAAAQVEAQTELAAVQARVEAGEAYEDVEADIDAIQADLEVAYDNASVEAQSGWDQTQLVFVELEQSLRDGAGDVLEYFAELSLFLEADVRVDEEDEIGVSEDEV